MPINRKDYPPDWRRIRWQVVVERAQGQCEHIYPSGNRCEARDWHPHPVTGSMVVLACCHLDHDRTNNDMSNLAAFCQLHHNQHDADQHAETLDEYRRQQRAEAEKKQRDAGQMEMDL